MIHSNNLIYELKKRELISQITNEKFLLKKLEKEKITVYCGFDPTSDSLHIGHLIPLICLKHFEKKGHKSIILLGGATALIGDPSLKKNERILQNNEKITIWTKKIHQQISLFLKHNLYQNTLILNNYKWFKNITLLSFLRKIGKNFSVKKMLNKESVKIRIRKKNSGISFTEFTYSLLQSYDFSYLFQKHNVILQIGGSDQWGNITSGIELTNRLYQKEVFGITVPLITNSSGNKFGKSKKDCIWLDKKKTTPYKFYQFWLKVSDTDVCQFLKIFTFLDIEIINILIKKAQKKSSILQKILAENVTKLVHGNKALKSAIRITKNLFLNNLNKLKKSDFKQLAQDGIPTICISKTIDIKQALVNAQLSKSRTEAKKMILANAISINGKKENSQNYIFNDKDKFFGHYTILCRGNKNHSLIYWI